MNRISGATLLACGAIFAGPANAQMFDMFSDAVEAQSAALLQPEEGVKETVSAGDPLIRQRNHRTAKGVRLDGPAVSPPKVSNKFEFRSGEELFHAKSSKVFKACWTRLGPTGYAPCLLDDDKDGKFDRAASDSISGAHPLAHPVGYSFAEVSIPPAQIGFTRTILYQGTTADGLKLSYREFSASYARPAFNEELSIPLSKTFPQKVAAKGIVFTIYSIDGLEMTYEINDATAFR